MRKFKFRAWYQEERRMEYQEGKTSLWVGDILTNSYYVPMQFTGLCDKNGREIYEGDIIRETVSILRPPTDDNLGAGQKITITIDGVFAVPVIVVTMPDIFSMIGGTRTMMFERDYAKYVNGEYFEILGNIYENPELLSKKEDAEENADEHS